MAASPVPLPTRSRRSEHLTLLGSIVGGLAPSLSVAAATDAEKWWLVILVAIIGSGATQATIRMIDRRRTGEGPAAAVKDIEEAAVGLVATSATLNLPLRQRIAELTSDLAAMTQRHADSRIENHEMRSELAAMSSKVAALEYELETFRARDAIPGGRRADDTPRT